MNNNINRNDFLFFQNEVFKDMKELEKKINEKINTITTNINSNKEDSDNNFSKYNEKITQMMTIIESSDERMKINEQISSLKKNLNDITYTNKAKMTLLEKSINNITFKYDKIFLDNLTVPGIIGTACPFQNLSSFIDYSHKKIKELLLEKEKQNTDMRSYKEKLETIIASFNKQIRNIESQFGEYCHNSFKSYEKSSNDKYQLLEEKINNMRIENGKYSYDLIQKTNELKIKWDKIQKIQDEIYDKLNEELFKHVSTSNNLCKIFNYQREEFKLLKSRFTELSDFIKDVRFRNNINMLNNSQNETEFEKKMKFKKMSKRINFNLKQKLDKFDNNTDRDKSFDKYYNKDNILLNNKEDNQQNILNKSFSNFLENNNNKQKEKSGIILNKRINLGKVTSTLKNYFNQNKEYKTIKFKEDKIISKFNRHKFGLSNKNLNNNEDNKNEDILNEEEEKKIKGIIKKKNIFRRGKSSRNLKINNLNIKEDEDMLNKSSKLLPLIPSTKKIFNIFSRNNNPINIKINNNNLSYKNIKNHNTENFENLDESNKNSKNSKGLSIENLKLAHLNNKKISIKGRSTKNFHLNKILPSNSSKKIYNDLPDISINKIDDIINTIKNYTINTNTTDNSNNLINISQKEKIKIKAIDFSNENSINNNNDNFDNNKKDINNNFSFITNANIKNSPNQNNNNNELININQINVNFNSLNKKIIKTNKRINDLNQNLEIKYNKLYKYIKKLFGEITGKLFFKDFHKFNSDFSPKKIYTTTNLQMNMPNKTTHKFSYHDIDKTIKEKNNFSPQNLKKIDSYKSIINNIEPYLIKKFKE